MARRGSSTTSEGWESRSEPAGGVPPDAERWWRGMMAVNHVDDSNGRRRWPEIGGRLEGPTVVGREEPRRGQQEHGGQRGGGIGEGEKEQGAGGEEARGGARRGRRAGEGRKLEGQEERGQDERAKRAGYTRVAGVVSTWPGGWDEGPAGKKLGTGGATRVFPTTEIQDTAVSQRWGHGGSDTCGLLPPPQQRRGGGALGGGCTAAIQTWTSAAWVPLAALRQSA